MIDGVESEAVILSSEKLICVTSEHDQEVDVPVELSYNDGLHITSDGFTYSFYYDVSLTSVDPSSVSL